MKNVIFDLDYTLYDMNQVLRHSYHNVIVGLSSSIGIPQEKIRSIIDKTIVEKGILYERMFDSLLAELQLSKNEYLNYCLKLYHKSLPVNLDLYSGMRHTLEVLNSKYSLYMMTDGNAKTQRRKVEKLSLGPYFKKILYTNDFNTSKPEAFEISKDYFSVGSSETLMIGDHPSKDIYGAIKVGFSTIRILRGAFAILPNEPGYEPDYTFDYPTKITKVL